MPTKSPFARVFQEFSLEEEQQLKRSTKKAKVNDGWVEVRNKKMENNTTTMLENASNTSLIKVEQKDLFKTAASDAMQRKGHFI